MAHNAVPRRKKKGMKKMAKSAKRAKSKKKRSEIYPGSDSSITSGNATACSGTGNPGGYGRTSINTRMSAFGAKLTLAGPTHHAKRTSRLTLRRSAREAARRLDWDSSHLSTLRNAEPIDLEGVRNQRADRSPARGRNDESKISATLGFILNLYVSPIWSIACSKRPISTPP